MTTKECLDLYDSFKKNEQETEVLGSFSEGAFPCVRLDGFRHSQRFLKDKLYNASYSRAANDSVLALHRCTRRLFDNSYAENWVLGCSFSDEVSIVLGNSLTNWRFDRRMMKICSVLAGDLSSYFTAYARERYRKQLVSEAPNKKHPLWTPALMAYDARPLQFSSSREIAQYLRHRYLVACRYAYWKVLRLNGEEYTDDLPKKDLEFLRGRVEQRGLADSYEKLIAGFTLYYPDIASGHLIVRWNLTDIEMSIESLTICMDNILTRLGFKVNE